MTNLELARTLVGKRVKFNHQRGLPESHLVIRATEDGLVEVEGWAGTFAPHLFTVVPDDVQAKLDAGDNIGALCALVKEAGGTMRLHGVPVTENELRTHAGKLADKKIADLIDRSSIGAGLRDIAERGIDEHAVDLTRDIRRARRGRKRKR